MDLAGFWELIALSRGHDDPDARLGWLRERLAALPPGDIVDFQLHLDELRRPVDTWLLWGAAYQICGRLCSDDGFWYFQAWLIGLGQETYERIIAAPDTLVDVPEVKRLAGRSVDEWDDAEWPDWEALDYVAGEAYEQVTGKEHGLDEVLETRGHDSPLSPDPVDDPWNFDDPQEVSRRLPRVARMFPVHDHWPPVRSYRSL
ncbi:MAG TPA: DUF4240 domain-containing protein [Micromonosporaceae bacterium]|nr:DUF4240 domain-containing protein [Micromonosporaceae bacterium]